MSAKITAVRLAAAHEGIAELVVSVTHDNGGISEVPLDRHATDALLRACDTKETRDLIGASWVAVRDALSASFNRFENEEGE